MKVSPDDVKTFLEHFRKTHPHISHNESIRKVKKWMEPQMENEEVLHVGKLRILSDRFSDYILSQGLEDDIQL